MALAGLSQSGLRGTGAVFRTHRGGLFRNVADRALNNPSERLNVSWLLIILLVIVVLAVLGFFGRGRFN